jgi:hypothetical protein
MTQPKTGLSPVGISGPLGVKGVYVEVHVLTKWTW